MPGREDKAITVQPAGTLRVMHERVAIKDSADLGGAERQAEVPRGARMDGVDGEAAGLIGCLGKEVGLQGHILGEKLM